jgi:hypothetical protein
MCGGHTPSALLERVSRAEEQIAKTRVAAVLRGVVGEIWKCLKSLGLNRNACNTVLVERTKRKLQETLIEWAFSLAIPAEQARHRRSSG